MASSRRAAAVEPWLLWPPHLFSEVVRVIPRQARVYLVEDPQYFTAHRYHRLKLAYHIATMAVYRRWLVRRGYRVTYVKHTEVTRDWYAALGRRHAAIHMFDPGEDTRLAAVAPQLPGLRVEPTLNFTQSRADIRAAAAGFTNADGSRSFARFYAAARRRLGWLVDAAGNPVGGRWSYDSENRRNYPRGHPAPRLPWASTRVAAGRSGGRSGLSAAARARTVAAAVTRVRAEFPRGYGDLAAENLVYPLSFGEADAWCARFFRERLARFGPYEDARRRDIPCGYHSVQTPQMNVGLLTDTQLLRALRRWVKRHRVPRASLEAFLRQVIGWRAYVWAVYVLDGPALARANQHGCRGKIGDEYWTATTGIAPIDGIIRGIVARAYAHHIERLMWLGNWFLITERAPSEVYRIFMEWTIDGYEWVMVPNVTMATNNSNLMMTRAYLCSSRYALRMSDEPRGDWEAAWDAHYNRFIERHAAALSRNYATARQVATWRRTVARRQSAL